MSRTLGRRSAPRDAEEDYEADEPATEETEEEDEGHSRRSVSKRRSRRDEKPERGRKSHDSDRSERHSSSVGRGREAYKAAKARGSKFSAEDRFTVDDDEYLIHFLEEWAFASWNEHWINEIRDGKKSFVCLGEDCPMCESGLKVGYKAAFNIVTFDKKGNPSVKYWIATPDPLGCIEDKDDNKRTSPINRDDLYFAVSKKKKGGRYTYSLETISLEDVESDFKVEPLIPDELKDFAGDLFTEEDVVSVSTRRELLDVLDDLED